MPRKVAFSAKQKRLQLREKKALKRGDLSEPTPAKPGTKKSRRRRPPTKVESAEVMGARMLESSFSTPSTEFLEASKNAAATVPLIRPIPAGSKILGSEEDDQGMTCPRRPEWAYGMTKKEVGENEEKMFREWIAETDTILDAWRKSKATSDILPATTYYERNIEVWRQFWRVCELSSIIMVLLDARCPPLHYPPSLDAYIRSLRPTRQVILVLTKIDIVGEDCASRWRSWLKERQADLGIQVVGIQSYECIREGQGSRVKHQPHLPSQLRDELRDALKAAHDALLKPPPGLEQDPEALAEWKAGVRAHVDWNALGDPNADSPIEASASVYVPPESLAFGNSPTTEKTSEDLPFREHPKDSPLTVGLIGQPNVGKSSLLNALFERHRVKTSRTPGKTKHFQTHFLTPELRLIDCPGLVFPALVQMELQVLSDILPIAQIPALPACIHYIGDLMPIERIFRVEKSMLGIEEHDKVVEDKRTWRTGMQPTKRAPQPEKEKWTALQVMSAYAVKRGWMTARTGWPDTMRAGDAMMRDVVEGRVPWAFWPPSFTPPPDDYGIWLNEQPEFQGDDFQSSESESGNDSSADDASSAQESFEEDNEEGEEM